MITSLTIRNRTASNTYTDTVLRGLVRISSGCYTSIQVQSQTVIVSTDYENSGDNSDQVPVVLMSIWTAIKALQKFPYLTALVAPGTSDTFTVTMRANDAWILNGNLTMVTPASNNIHGLIYTDLGKRALSDEDFQDLQDCCRILRSWLDMAKDNMLSTVLKWNSAPYQPSRPNCSHCDNTVQNNLSDPCPACTTASQKPLALYKQYKAVVWLWNYLVGATAAQLKVAPHPADAAGVIVAVTVNLPKCYSSALSITPINRLKISIQADITSDQIPVLLFWARRTMVASAPSCQGLTSNSIYVEVTKNSKNTATVYIESYIALKPASTYQVVSVFEIFPYYKDEESSSDDSSSSSDISDSNPYIEGTMSGYYRSRTNYNYDSQGTTSWAFEVNIGYDEYLEEELITLSHTTATPYAAAPEPEENV